jgi:predicted N-acetyltransferase YhbS
VGAISDFRITPPERLTAEHDLSQFRCGEPSLDNWLRDRAIQNESSGASRTYVVSSEHRVVGYYALSASAVAHSDAASRVKRNMPDPVPVILIGRLAIDSRFQSQGVGADLLRDAVLRIMHASEIAGIRAILVNALSMEASTFYKRFGFVPSPANPQTLMITVTEAARILIRRN